MDSTDNSTPEERMLAYWENFYKEETEKQHERLEQQQELAEELGKIGINPYDSAFELKNIPADAIDLLDQTFNTDLRETDEAIQAENIANHKEKPKKKRRPMQRI